MQTSISFLFTISRNNYLIESLALPVDYQSFLRRKFSILRLGFEIYLVLIFAASPTKSITNRSTSKNTKLSISVLLIFIFTILLKKTQALIYSFLMIFLKLT